MPLTRRRGLRRISKKRKEKLRAAAPIRQAYRDSHPNCLRCEWLGATVPATALHHIQGGSYGRPETPENYAMLCHACHRLRHHGHQDGPCVRTVHDQIVAAKGAAGEAEPSKRKER